MEKFKKVSDMMKAMKAGKIPVDVIFVSGAARQLGVSRQAIHQRCKYSGSLESWEVDGVIIISQRSVTNALEKRLRTAEGQQVLDGIFNHELS